MTLIERIEVALRSKDDGDLRGLLAAALAHLILYDGLAKSLAAVYSEVDPAGPPIPGPLGVVIADLVLAADAIRGREGKMVRYDKLDPANPPAGLRIEECPNCKLPGRVYRTEGATVYVHTAWRLRGSRTARRHYCELSDDGLRVDVVIPVMPAKEGS
jgi:hypothetical protein